MASESAQKSERRLKFSSVRKLERQDALIADDTTDAATSKHGGLLAAVGGILTTGYAAIAGRILLGFEVMQDVRAARRAAVLRGSARAKALSSP
jgi:hypothetical protein